MLSERTFKLLSDRTRIRILMLLDKGELCVCQIMAVLDVSQPLVSKNLSLLSAGGFLDERRDGKLVFYSIRKELDPGLMELIGLLKKSVVNDIDIKNDFLELNECMQYQKKKGTCDMKSFKEYMNRKKRRKKNA